ncbi:MAG: theronine dehydrogenase, partial [Mycobacterium sp.]
MLFGSVNAGRRHYQQAADALARVDRRRLERLITRRV